MADVLGMDVVGFGVEATDGHAGKVRGVTDDGVLMPSLVVKPGMLRKMHVIPMAAVRRVDGRQHRVSVKMSKHQILDAPQPGETDPMIHGNPETMDARNPWNDRDPWIDGYV
jgi:hypothetical protein